MTRITPYADGGEVGERVDEIVLSGDVHLEMMSETAACLWIGDRMFHIWAHRAKLIVRFIHGPVLPDAPTTPAPVGDARGEG